jgi:hypothetical protein
MTQTMKKTLPEEKVAEKESSDRKRGVTDSKATTAPKKAKQTQTKSAKAPKSEVQVTEKPEQPVAASLAVQPLIPQAPEQPLPLTEGPKRVTLFTERKKDFNKRIFREMKWHQSDNLLDGYYDGHVTKVTHKEWDIEVWKREAFNDLVESVGTHAVQYKIQQGKYKPQEGYIALLEKRTPVPPALQVTSPTTIQPQTSKILDSSPIP